MTPFQLLDKIEEKSKVLLLPGKDHAFYHGFYRGLLSILIKKNKKVEKFLKERYEIK
jgi:hypothetical protein